MGSAWGPGIYDTAAWNATQIDEVNLLDFEEMLVDEVDMADWDDVGGINGGEFKLEVDSLLVEYYVNGIAKALCADLSILCIYNRL